MPRRKLMRQKCLPRPLLLSTNAKVAVGEAKLPEPPPFELLSPRETEARAAYEKYLAGFAKDESKDEDYVVVSHEETESSPPSAPVSKPK